MRAFGILALFGIVIGALVTVGLIVLAFLGIRAALAVEKNRRLKKAPDRASQDSGAPLFSAKRRE